MNSIKAKALVDRLLSQKQDEGKNIQEQIVIGEQLDTIQRDAQRSLHCLREQTRERRVLPGWRQQLSKTRCYGQHEKVWPQL